MRTTPDPKILSWGHLLRTDAVSTQLMSELQIASKLLDAAIRNQRGERAERYFKLAQSALLQVGVELQEEDPTEHRYPEVRSALAALSEQFAEYSSCFATQPSAVSNAVDIN
jgi:hypothetical protein